MTSTVCGYSQGLFDHVIGKIFEAQENGMAEAGFVDAGWIFMEIDEPWEEEFNSLDAKQQDDLARDAMGEIEYLLAEAAEIGYRMAWERSLCHA